MSVRRSLLPFALALLALPGCGPGPAPVEPAVPVAVETTGGPVAPDAGAPPALAAFDPAIPAVPTGAVGWPQFRGPNRTGLAVGTDPPVEWSETKNVRWVADVPGRGYSSPAVADGRVFLTTADEAAETQSLLCYDFATGDRLWMKQVAAGSLPTSGMHGESTHASATPAVGGGAVFTAFLHDGAVWAAGYSVEGEKLWGEVKLGGFDPQFGYGVSPVLYGPVAIFSGDNKAPGFLTALDRETGEVRWRTPREAGISFNTPLIARLNGRDTLILAGRDRLDGYDPADGSPLWSVPGLTANVAGSAVAANLIVDGAERAVVIASGGYPGSETLAVLPPLSDGNEPTVAWRNDEKAYVPSPLIAEGLAFLTADDGRTFCYDAATGEELWKTRLPEPTFRASAVAAGMPGAVRVYQPSSRGLTTVYAADGERFRKLAENQLGEETYASPAVAGDSLLIRTASGTGADRREKLYRIAAE